MNILIDINHPSQVHLFRNAVKEWQKHGHNVLIVAREKDVTIQLLNEYELEYIVGSQRRPGLFNLVVELISKTLKIWRVAKKINPDVFLSLGSPPAAWAAFLSNKPHIAFTDTEHSREQLALYAPFSKRIYTPQPFLRNLGSKQHRYAGYHELAYLHPNRFTPNPKTLERYGLSGDQDYFIVRLVSFEATHDVNRSGISSSALQELLELLREHGKVIISSEAEKGMTIMGEENQIPPSNMHDLLSYATIFIGEGTTMATEAALLGTPAITLTPHVSGNRLELENEYGLVKAIRDPEQLQNQVKEFLKDKQLKQKWQEKRTKLLNDKIDVTEYMVNEIEDYIKSLG